MHLFHNYRKSNYYNRQDMYYPNSKFLIAFLLDMNILTALLSTLTAIYDDVNNESSNEIVLESNETKLVLNPIYGVAYKVIFGLLRYPYYFVANPIVLIGKLIDVSFHKKRIQTNDEGKNDTK